MPDDMARGVVSAIRSYVARRQLIGSATTLLLYYLANRQRLFAGFWPSVGTLGNLGPRANLGRKLASASADPSKASVYDEPRIYDVKAPGLNEEQYRELKFGPDPVIKAQIVKDRHIIGVLHRDVTYDLVPDPVTGKGPSQRDLDTLSYWGIPWKVWGPEFWKRLSPT